MLMPRKVKHRKWQKRTSSGAATQKTELAFGSVGLKSLEERWVTARQIESARRVISRQLKRGGKLWIRIFPDRPVTFKGLEVVMGGGKGSVDHYVAAVKPGMILFEVDGVAHEQARAILLSAAYKLPVKTRILTRS
jgi:large subunit ribosomal protein L16